MLLLPALPRVRYMQAALSLQALVARLSQMTACLASEPLQVKSCASAWSGRRPEWQSPVEVCHSQLLVVPALQEVAVLVAVAQAMSRAALPVCVPAERGVAVQPV